MNSQPVSRAIQAYNPTILHPYRVIELLFSIRSERSLIEHIDYNILYRWFIGLHLDEPVWSHSTFSKNRDRLIDSEVALSIPRLVLKRVDEEGLLSNEHVPDRLQGEIDLHICRGGPQSSENEEFGNSVNVELEKNASGE